MNKHIIYMASGSSKRFGSNKLLHSIEGKPMYLWGLEMLKEVVQHRGDCDLTVVSRYEEIRFRAEEMGISAVDSPDSDKGVSYTIRAGLNTLKEIKPEDFVMFVVADQPYLTHVSVEKVLDSAKDGVEGISLAYGERPGNPTLFSAKLIPELMELTGDTGGRAVLRRHECIFVQADSEKELEDIDVRIKGSACS